MRAVMKNRKSLNGGHSNTAKIVMMHGTKPSILNLTFYTGNQDKELTVYYDTSLPLLVPTAQNDECSIRMYHYRVGRLFY